jgi:hypothetical protein
VGRFSVMFQDSHLIYRAFKKNILHNIVPYNTSFHITASLKFPGTWNAQGTSALLLYFIATWKMEDYNILEQI